MFEEIRIVFSLQAIAKHFGKTERTIRRWKAEGMPVETGGGYDLTKIEAWRLRGGGDPSKADALDLGPPLDSAKAEDIRYKRAKADLAEMEAKQRRGELVERAKLHDEIVQRHKGLRAGLLVLARALPPMLVDQSEREMEIIINAAVRELLLAWSRPLPDELGGAEIPSEAQI